jgi:GT2 family glycosyltransferase
MTRPKIVLLGMLTKMPVAGVGWLVAHYAIGLRRLGFDVYYVECHARTPSMLMRHANDDATARAVEFLHAEMSRLDMGNRWAFHALHDDGACHGMSWDALKRLYADAALIVNMHGGTEPMDEHAATGRLVFLGTDPGEIEFEIARDDQRAIAVLEMHSAFFTWGLNYGNPDCKLPWSSRFVFTPSPPPVVLDLWVDRTSNPGSAMTTIGNWRQPWRNIRVDGETYRWSKHHEFLKVIDLPRRVDTTFELALGSYEPSDEELLRSHGWAVRPAVTISSDPDSYRDYITGSRGEFTVAKDQNVRLRSGWFSERSAAYLASGRPVVMQDTGFGNFLGADRGLLGFDDLDGAVAAIEAVNADYRGHCRAALAIAREHLDADVVLRSLLGRCGIAVPVRQRRTLTPTWPSTLDLIPRVRRPLRLPQLTVDHVLARPLPFTHHPGPPLVSIVMVAHNEQTVTRLGVESILAHTDEPFELIVVDNASSAPTREYLEVIAARNPHVRLVANVNNRGFAGAVNQGLGRATTDVLIVVNNDIIVTPGWTRGLREHLDDPTVGAVGPVTNRCGNHAEIPTAYRTYGELLAFAAERAGAYVGVVTELPMLVMFCFAMRRAVFEQIGPLDEQFGIGLFEDDDYARRLTQAGLRMLCAEDVFIHHFGEASFSRLYASGRRSEQFERNQAKFEAKWHVVWSPHGHRCDESYDHVVAAVRAVVRDLLRRGGAVAVISKGDDRLVDVEEGSAWHFPCALDGSFAGHYPGNGDEALAMLQGLEARGLTHLAVPRPADWWLDHYPRLRARLAEQYRRVPGCDPDVLVFELTTPCAASPLLVEGIRR